MKTTIYELLGMIKDGKAPYKIKVFAEEMYYDEKEMDYKDNDGDYLFIDYSWKEAMNTWVEILETTITYNPTYEIINNKKYLVKYENGETLYEYIEDYKPDKIEKVNTYVLCDSDFHSKGEYSLKATEIIDRAFEEYSYKINEIIDYINKEMK